MMRARLGEREYARFWNSFRHARRHAWTGLHRDSWMKRGLIAIARYHATVPAKLRRGVTV